MRIWTLGHSNRSLEATTALLREQGVTRLLDVRTLPRSRHNPQHNTESLRGSLHAAGIAYSHLPALGGMHKPKPHSMNLGWREEGFRGYADHMQTPEFERALVELLTGAAREPAAFMCAEADPARCHRSLLADAISVRGVEVRHIMGPGTWRTHLLTSFAEVQGTLITYPFMLEG